MTPYASLLKTLRLRRGVLQADVANATHISRPSYVAVEKGTKELTLSEAVSLTLYYGITLDELVSATTPDDSRYEAMLRVMLRAAASDRVTVKKTKLAKLLYLVDFSWYYLHHISMSGQPYRKLAFGPTPDVFFRLIEELELRGTITITQVAREDYHMYEITETKSASKEILAPLRPPELAHIHNIWKSWRDASTAEILTFTNKQAPYCETNDGEIIDYDLILDVPAHEVM
jgi:transcriptional regulator with XRE-family HTH domain